MIGLSLAPVRAAPAPTWLLAQLATLTGWLESDGHRWPPVRVAVALRAIHAGDEHWRDRAAEAGR